MKCEKCKKWIDEADFSGLINDEGFCKEKNKRKKAEDGKNCTKFKEVKK